MDPCRAESKSWFNRQPDPPVSDPLAMSNRFFVSVFNVACNGND